MNTKFAARKLQFRHFVPNRVYFFSPPILKLFYFSEHYDAMLKTVRRLITPAFSRNSSFAPIRTMSDQPIEPLNDAGGGTEPLPISENGHTVPSAETENSVSSPCDGGPAAKPPSAADARPVYKWKKAKKMAALLSFSGKDYLGMQLQRGHGVKTIEGEFLAALRRSGMIDPEWEDNPQKAFLQRASRTDKGRRDLFFTLILSVLDTVPDPGILIG